MEKPACTRAYCYAAPAASETARDGKGPTLTLPLLLLVRSALRRRGEESGLEFLGLAVEELVGRDHRRG